MAAEDHLRPEQFSHLSLDQLKGLKSENFEGKIVGEMANLRWDKEDLPAAWGEDYKALKADIAKNGITTPLSVKNGVLLDGHHRAYAAMELGLDRVPVTEQR